MEIKMECGIVIRIDDDKLVSWSKEDITGIYTMTLTDGSVWKYESETKSFYRI